MENNITPTDPFEYKINEIHKNNEYCLLLANKIVDQIRTNGSELHKLIANRMDCDEGFEITSCHVSKELKKIFEELYNYTTKNELHYRTVTKAFNNVSKYFSIIVNKKKQEFPDCYFNYQKNRADIKHGIYVKFKP